MNGAWFRFLPDGRILLGERNGTHPDRRQGRQGRRSRSRACRPNMFAQGQALFSVQPDRSFATNRTIYFTYAVLPAGADPAKQRSPAHVHVASAKISADDKSLEGVKDLLDAEGTGGRVIQAARRHAARGDHRARGPRHQLERVDAAAAARQPDGQGAAHQRRRLRSRRTTRSSARPGARPEIYALGFRDPQGLAIQPKTGRLWTSEHGPRGGDEINEVEKGKNYGFPVIGYGRDYTGKPINNDKTAQAGLEQPVYFWTPDIAPAGIGFYTGKMFPAWDGNLFVSALAGRYLVRLVLDGNHVVAEERLLDRPESRIRDVNEGPDGALYVLTDGANGKILRLKK